MSAPAFAIEGDVVVAGDYILACATQNRWVSKCLRGFK
jgi:hypothetical protein